MTIDQPDFESKKLRDTQLASAVVYVAFAEVKPRHGCRVLNASEYRGALAMCFLPASCPDDALSKLEARLEKEKLELVAIEYCVDASAMPELDDDDRERVLMASSENEVSFGNIVAWGEEGIEFE